MSRRRTLDRAMSLRAERDDVERTQAEPERATHRTRNLTSLLRQGGLPTLTNDISRLHRQLGNSTLRRLASKESFVAPTQVEGILRQERGRGQPLDSAVRGPMARAVGADLDGVRIHTDERATELSGELSARAFTHGRDIYFASGEYAPGSEGGQRVLAHELAHVAQQRSGAKLVVGSADDPYEREADRVADRVMRTMRDDKARAGGELRRQVEEEEEEMLQPLRRQEEEEEAQLIRRQEEEEEEEEEALM